MEKISLINKTVEQIVELLIPYKVPKFRAKQIWEWINKGASDFNQMTNLPADLRNSLSQNFIPAIFTIEKRLVSADGKTTKLLLKFDDNTLIETVLMRTNYGNSICVSSQVGCAMGCAFCASTLLGLKRNLTADEMLVQTKAGSFELGNERLSHVVVMGSGEPLMNLENLKIYLETIHDPAGLNIGFRHITVSTCGIVSGIDTLTSWGYPINLAISLHAPTDELRSTIMPINKRYKLSEVIASADRFVEKTNRLITYEYILLGGVNDTTEHAEQLSKLLRGRLALVNLIPWNPVDERNFKASSKNAINNFKNTLEQNKIKTTIRHERGSDIDSACGQLRYNEMKG